MEFLILERYKEKRKEYNKGTKGFRLKVKILLIFSTCIMISSAFVPNHFCKENRVLYLLLFLLLYLISCASYWVAFRSIKKISSDNGDRRYKELLILLNDSIKEIVEKCNVDTMDVLIAKCNCIVEQHERKNSIRISYIFKSCSIIGLVTSFLVVNNDSISKGNMLSNAEWEKLLVYIIAIASAVAIFELLLIVVNKVLNANQGFEDMLDKLYDLKMYMY